MKQEVLPSLWNNYKFPIKKSTFSRINITCEPRNEEGFAEKIKSKSLKQYTANDAPLGNLLSIIAGKFEVPICPNFPQYTPSNLCCLARNAVARQAFYTRAFHFRFATLKSARA